MTRDLGPITPRREPHPGDEHAQTIRALLGRIHGRDDTAGKVSVLTGAARGELDALGGFAGAVDEQIAAGKVRLQFWACPVDGHSDSDWRHPRETVRWDGDVARCTWPGCGRTSRDGQDPVPPGTMR